MKVVDTRAYVGMLRELTEAGHEVNMVIAGNSMAPFLIHQRDVIWFKKPGSPLKRGDMVFYQRRNGDFVMHRIWRVRDEGIYTVGDGQFQIEGPLQPQQVFARITRIQRKGKIIAPGSFWWWFFARVWLHIPLRRPLYGIYHLLKRDTRSARAAREEPAQESGGNTVPAAAEPVQTATEQKNSYTAASGIREEGRGTYGEDSTKE